MKSHSSLVNFCHCCSDRALQQGKS